MIMRIVIIGFAGVTLTHLMNTHVVNMVKQMPMDEKTSGTRAHGDSQSMISAGILSHSVIFTLGRQPGLHVMHVSFSA
jgi:hypothetical protein